MPLKTKMMDVGLVAKHAVPQEASPDNGSQAIYRQGSV